MTDHRSKSRELARMVARRDETRQLIAIITDSLRRKAERSTLADRPKTRALGRGTSTWASRHESDESVRLLRTYGDQAASMDVSRRSGLRSRFFVGVQM